MAAPVSAVAQDWQEGTELYHLIAEGIPNMVWTARPDGGLDFLNRRVFEYTGLTAAELREWGWRDVIHPEDIAMCEARWRRSLETGVNYEVEYRVRRGSDGSYRWHIGAALPLRHPDGRIAKWFGTCTDIEDQKRAAYAQMSLAMQTAQMAHWSWSTAEGLKYSEGMGPLFGLERGLQYARAKEWIKVVHPDDRGALIAAARESFASGRLLHHDWRVVKPDGSVAWMSSRAQTQYDDSGRAARMIGITMDITQLRTVQEELEQYSERVKQLLYRLVDAQESERRNLASSLHDLIGQKLTALNMGLDILKRDMHATAGALVRSRLDSMATIVDETVDAVRGVMQDLCPSELEDFGLVPALYSHSKRFQEQTGIRTTVDAIEPYARLPSNVELAFFRVAQEALTNAVKHSGAANICIRAWQEPGRASLTIEDDGRGFSDPQGARSVWRGGWGLPEMRKRAEAVGGQVQVEFPASGGARVLMHVVTDHAD